MNRTHSLPTGAGLGASAFRNVALASVTCPRCRRSHEGVARTSLLGFRRYSCWRCLSDFRYPLHRRYRVAYWTLLAGAAGYTMLSHGRVNAVLVLAGLAVAWDAWMVVRRSGVLMRR